MLEGNKIKLGIATNNLDKSKKEFSKALTDLRVHTCERVRRSYFAHVKGNASQLKPSATYRERPARLIVPD